MSDLPLFDPFKALEEIRRKNRGAEATPPLAKTLAELSQPSDGETPHSDQRDNQNSSTLAALAGGAAHDAPTRAREKEEERKEKSIKSYTYAGGEAPEARPSMPGPGAPARVARTASKGPTDCNERGLPKIGPARVSGSDLAFCRSALSALSPDRIPCPGYRAEEWPRVLARALAFLDTFGSQAEALGWNASRLFGVHPTAGIVRVDACGALVLPNAGAVRAITATEVSFGHLTYRTKPGQPAGVPWWEFGR